MKTTAYTLALLLAASSVAGCGSINVNLENRVACTVAKDKAFVVSQWGAVGISSNIAEPDRAVICK